MGLTVSGRILNDARRVFVIAEASGNHRQDFSVAMDLVSAAAEAGADAIKFQTFTAEEICADIPFPFGHDEAHDAWARSLGVECLRDLFQLGGLPREWHAPLKAYAEQRGIAFLSTPFSVDAARFLVEEVGVQALKIASGDLTFTPLIDYAARTNLPVILSTGGANMFEVVRTRQRWQGEEPPIFMHCVSVYPAEDTIVNLAAIRTMHDGYGLRVGFSDHTLSTDLVPAMAIACGARVYEKHIRLQDDTESVDAGHSLNPVDFRRMVDVIRRAPRMLGNGVKKPHALELHDRIWARRDPSDWLRPTQKARTGAWE